MGLWISRLVGLFGEKEARILVLGLDNAGKTTILCKLLSTSIIHTQEMKSQRASSVSVAALRNASAQLTTVVLLFRSSSGRRSRIDDSKYAPRSSTHFWLQADSPALHSWRTTC